MRFLSTVIPGAMVIESEPYNDERGSFERLFCTREFAGTGVPMKIAQINRSRSRMRGTVRGLHFQRKPMSECKIVQCLCGTVFDVVVDVRRSSPTYLQWHAELLSEWNGKALCVPKGCAHGFQTLTDNAEVLYFSDEFYSPEHEHAINIRDPRIAIKWPLPVAALSDKDRNAPFLEQFIENEMVPA
jgi:dTDP-4-dehydrorhamnose 3,5-epimerase